MQQQQTNGNNTNMYLIGGLLIAVYLYATNRSKLKNIADTVIEPNVQLDKVSNRDLLLQYALEIKKAFDIYIWGDIDTDLICSRLRECKSDYDLQYLLSAMGQIEGPLLYKGDFFQAVNTFPSITASERRKIAKEMRSFAYKIDQ